MLEIFEFRYYLIVSIIFSLCFFFIIIFNTFSIIPVVKENTRVKLAFAIPGGTPITLAKETIDIHPLVPDKTINVWSK